MLVEQKVHETDGAAYKAWTKEEGALLHCRCNIAQHMTLHLVEHMPSNVRHLCTCALRCCSSHRATT